MFRISFLAVAVAAASGVIAGPSPPAPDAKDLVAGLSDPDETVRDAASAALRGRVDALPWLRRAARSKVPITSARAAKLLAPHEQKRQEVVAKALDGCIRDGRIDLVTEWHQYWQPRDPDELWAVGPRAAKAGLDLYARSCPQEQWADLEKKLNLVATLQSRSHDGPAPEGFEPFKGAWNIRTDRLDRMDGFVHFASVAGPARLLKSSGGHFLVLGSVQTDQIIRGFVACEGDVWHKMPEEGLTLGVTTHSCVVVCRGNFTGATMQFASVLLVDGDIDLTRTSYVKHCLIRASGEIRMPTDKAFKPENSTIEAHAKEATAPYKFFELSDVGLSLADDEEGLVVTGVKANTPFGNCGIAKGDLIRAVDDADVKDSEEFRKKVRRALVRQGDCLVTITRGNKALDLPVFFPLPK